MVSVCCAIYCLYWIGFTWWYLLSDHNRYGGDMYVFSIAMGIFITNALAITACLMLSFTCKDLTFPRPKSVRYVLGACTCFLVLRPELGFVQIENAIRAPLEPVIIEGLPLIIGALVGLTVYCLAYRLLLHALGLPYAPQIPSLARCASAIAMLFLSAAMLTIGSLACLISAPHGLFVIPAVLAIVTIFPVWLYTVLACWLSRAD
jgi:hypothetical protein